MQNSPEFKKFLDLLRKSGVKSYETSEKGYRVEFAHEALLPESPYKRKKSDKEEAISDPIYTTEQLLEWSSAGIPHGEMQ